MKTETYKRSDEEIANAVKLLEENKASIARYNMFGDDNHAKADVKIDTIKNQRSEDYVYKTYPSVDDDDNEDSDLHGLWQAGVLALSYLRGEYEIEDLLIPVKKV